jgi:transcriptional regulator with XRE-family HTH domain
MTNIFYINEYKMDLKELGIEIQKLRKEKRLSQTQLCDDLKISRATLSSLENGKGIDIGIRKVIWILDYLGYQISIKEKNRFPTLEELTNGR